MKPPHITAFRQTARLVGDTEYRVPGGICLTWRGCRGLLFPAFPTTSPSAATGGQRTFFEDADFALYLDLLGEAAGRAHAEVWSIA